MIAIITGGRDYTDRERVFEALDILHAANTFTLIRHGAARGTDTLAAEWADSRSIAAHPCPADWDDITHPDARIRSTKDGRKYDANAGPRRNQAMLDLGADMVIAFPGGAGTADMTQRGIYAGVRVVVVSP